MELELQLGVAEMFRDATMESAVRLLSTDQDWSRFKDIREGAKEKEEQEVASFEEERPELLAQAREDILREVGALTHEHPTPFGVDRFRPERIEKQAETRVATEHQNRLLKLREAETEAYADLHRDITSRERNQDVSRKAFTQAAERRDGVDRRGPYRTP